jgi:hypothetical protein
MRLSTTRGDAMVGGIKKSELLGVVLWRGMQGKCNERKQRLRRSGRSTSKSKTADSERGERGSSRKRGV